jgi:xyloglucan-specific exo-beta-1,4-glucanase
MFCNPLANHRSRRLVKSIFTVLTAGGVALAAHVVHAQTAAPQFSWDRVAIGGGGFNTGVYAHPRVRDKIFSRIDVGGMYRWDESTTRWSQTLDWMPTDFSAMKGVDGVALDPAAGREQVVYAALGQYPYEVTTSIKGNGLWRSLDDGKTWTRIFGAEKIDPANGRRIGAFGANMPDRMDGERVVIDPANSRRLYVATRNDGLYRSNDALNTNPTFQKITSIPDGVKFYGPSVILIDPRAGMIGQGNDVRSRVIYIAYSCLRDTCAKNVSGTPNVFAGGVYRSTDGGDSFQRIGGNNEPIAVKRMALGTNGSVLVVPREGNGILKWDSTAWSVLPQTENTVFNSVATDPANPDRIVAWSNPRFFGDLWRSQNGGQSWTQLNAQSANNGTLRLDAVNWLKVGYGLNVSQNVVFDPFNSNRIYWTEPYATYRADNVFADEVIAQPLLKGSETTVAFALAVPRAPSNVRLYSTFADVRGFRSTSLTDFPQTSIFPTNGGGMLSDVAIAPADSRSVIVSHPVERGSDGPFQDGLPRLKLSEDDGTTWIEKFGPPIDARNTDANKSAGAAKIAISATDKNRVVYFGSRRVPHYTTNAFSGQPIDWRPATGVPWDALSNYFEYDNSFIRLKADAVDGLRFYLTIGSADYSKPTFVYVSEDGGASWKIPATQSLPLVGYPSGRHLVSVKTNSDPTPSNGELWMSLGSNGVWRSTDGGNAFTQVNKDVLVYVRGIAFGKSAQPNGEPTLFAAGKVTINGALKDGVFFSTDLGQTFTQMTADETPYVGGQLIRDMAGDPDTFGRVFITLDGSGILYSQVRDTNKLTAGDYTLTAWHSGLMLDVPGATNEGGTALWQYNANGTPAQEWQIDPLNNAAYRLISKASGQCLDVRGADPANGAAVIQYPCNGGANQQWRIEATDNGFSKLIAEHSGKVLDVAGQSTASQTPVQQWEYGGGLNQQWKLTKIR